MKLIDAWAGTAPFDMRSRLLRRVLLCNAGSSFLFAVLLLGAGSWTAGLIGAPEAGPLLQVLGGGLLVFALGVEWVATRQPLQPSHGWAARYFLGCGLGGPAALPGQPYQSLGRGGHYRGGARRSGLGTRPDPGLEAIGRNGAGGRVNFGNFFLYYAFF